MRILLLSLTAVFILLASFTLLMFNLQTQFIFPAHAVGPAGPMSPGAEVLTLGTPDGETLSGVHIPPSKTGGNGTLILSFAGNAWNSQDAVSYVQQLYPDADVVGFHYRGYRPSTGEPSAAALFADALLIHDFAIARLAPKRVVAVGLSIGSGVAAHLASKRQVDGLILVTPFDSLKAVASGHYPFLPVETFFQHEMNSVEALEKRSVATAIIAAEQDTLIVAARTEGLRTAVMNLRYDRIISGAGHNDIYQQSTFQAAMREAITAVTR